MENTTQYDSEIQDLSARLKVLWQLRADTLCPFKVGDRIKRPKDGQLVIITRIKPNEYIDNYSMGYELYADYILKSGKASDVNHRLSMYDNWQKEVK